MFLKIDRYLLQSFILSLITVIIGFGLTFTVINIVEELRDFIDHHVAFMKIVEYYFYFGGWLIKSFLPMFILLSVLFSVSLLAKRNEIVAMKFSGISLYRITLPYFLAVMLLSAGHFYYNEYIFPPWNKKRLEIKNFTIEKKSKRSFNRASNIIRQIEPGYFYTLTSFNVTLGEGRDLKIYQQKNHRLSRLITAAQFDYVDHRWLARDGRVRQFDDPNSSAYYEFDTLTIHDIKDKPKDFARRIGKPEDMGIEELRMYIDLQKRTGGPFLREAIDLQLKYSFPCSSLIIVLICLPFASNPRRGGIAVSIAIGTIISLIYFVFFRILQSAGYNEKIPEFAAVWGVNIVFLIVGIIAMLKARK